MSGFLAAEPRLLHAAVLFLWFVSYSFAGWVYESVLVSVQSRRLVNRGFMNGPVCPIYGAGAVLGVLLLDPSYNVVVTFLSAATGACLLEYVTSWVMERLFHARWWDYSDFRFNLDGRVCLLGFVVFGVGGVVIVEYVQPVVAHVTSLVPPDWLFWSAVALAFLMSVDFTATVAGLSGFESSMAALRDRFVREVGPDGFAGRGFAGLQDGLRAMGARLQRPRGRHANRRAARSWTMPELRSWVVRVTREQLNFQQRRTIASFPHLRFTGVPVAAGDGPDDARGSGGRRVAGARKWADALLGVIRSAASGRDLGRGDDDADPQSDADGRGAPAGTRDGGDMAD